MALLNDEQKQVVAGLIDRHGERYAASNRVAGVSGQAATVGYQRTRAALFPASGAPEAGG